jgi:hypothetical protein
MKRALTYVLLLVAIVPIVYWFGYEQGAFHQQSLDAPSKALMVSKIAELYEEGDDRAHMLMYTYLDTELSLYEEYLESGNPFIAKLTPHEYFLGKVDEYLTEISGFIHSTNDGNNEYKQDVADRLERIGYKNHKNE